MDKPIFDTDFWKQRLALAVANERIHHAVYETSLDHWEAVAAKHKSILQSLISPTDVILDAGCGWGRLLRLLPDAWHMAPDAGYRYVGIDLSPDFISLAREAHRSHLFLLGNLCQLSCADQALHLVRNYGRFDWAICVSIRNMMEQNGHGSAWQTCLSNLRYAAHKVLILEYREEAEGEVL